MPDSVSSVLHVCTDFWPSTGGIERFVLDVAMWSRRSGVRADVLCLDRVRAVAGRLPPRDEVAGVPVLRIPFVDLRYYKPAWLPLKVIKGYDVVHVHGIGAQSDYLLATRRLHGRPIVVSTHGGIFHTQALRALKVVYFRGWQRLMLAGAAAVVACSESDRRLFSSVARGVRLIPNAVDTQRLLALPMQRKEPGRCLYVGRLAANKRLPELLCAFAAARATGVAATLRCVGPDPDGLRDEYERLAEASGVRGDVRFVGEVDERTLLDEYAAASVFVSASRHEGFGLSALEAKAAGCRLVLQDNAAFRDLFAGDRAAELLEFDDAEAAGRSIASALGAGVTADLESGRRDAALYSWDERIKEWLGLYADCAGR